MFMLCGGGGQLIAQFDKIRSDFSLIVNTQEPIIIEVTWLGLPDERNDFSVGNRNYLNFRDTLTENPILFKASYSQAGVPVYLEVKGCVNYRCTNGYLRWFKIRVFKA